MVTGSMKRGRVQLLAWTLVLCGAHLEGQDVFTLSIDGPSSITKPFGFAEETYHVLLSHAGTGPGAQAWSYGIKPSECVVLGITTAGTAADTVEKGGFRRGGFELTGGADFRGRYVGAVSAVVLSLDESVTLPANSTQKVARLGVRFDVGQAPVAGLAFTDEYRFGSPSGPQMKIG
jgi:hypothetical protein